MLKVILSRIIDTRLHNRRKIPEFGRKLHLLYFIINLFDSLLSWWWFLLAIGHHILKVELSQ